MKEIGILGGTRFIGFHLTRALLARGDRVTLFNRGRTRVPESFAGEVASVQGDRNHPRDLEAFFRRSYDVVFDLSGYTPEQVQPLLAPHHRDKIGHFVFCSTSSVYHVPPPCPYDETAPRVSAPDTYGGDKALTEELLMAEWRRDHWPVTIFRPQGVLGPFGPAQAGFVFARLSHDLPILLGPRRDFKINFLYVHDLVLAFLMAMSSDRSYGKVYNVAGNEAPTQVELINLCGEASAIEPRIRIVEDRHYRDLPVGVPWLDYDLVADNRLIKLEVGLPFTPLKEALAETWRWLRQAPQHLEPIPFRGERYVRENRLVPVYVRYWWKVEDLARSSALWQIWLPRLIALLKRSPTLTLLLHYWP